jgi:hypothetical protein
VRVPMVRGTRNGAFLFKKDTKDRRAEQPEYELRPGSQSRYPSGRCQGSEGKKMWL